MRARVPVVPTLIVALAVAAMVALGVWQLRRADEKRAAVARYAANAGLPPVALPALWPVRDADLFRRAGATCLSVVGWQASAGHAADGRSGWRHLAACRTGAEGPGFAVDVGVSDTAAPPAWAGGPVRGPLTWAPTGRPLIARLTGAEPPPVPLIVAEAPAPGLSPSARPDPADVPNNHLAYAVQWFLFAAVAAIVYAVALARRGVARRAPAR